MLDACCFSRRCFVFVFCGSPEELGEIKDAVGVDCQLLRSASWIELTVALGSTLSCSALDGITVMTVARLLSDVKS